jgi:hypothetical protein
VSTVLGSALPDQRAEGEWIEGVAIWIAVIAVTMVGERPAAVAARWQVNLHQGRAAPQI